MYPHGKNHGLLLYDSLVWIYFVVVSQKYTSRLDGACIFLIGKKKSKGACQKMLRGSIFPRHRSARRRAIPSAPAKSLGRFRSDREKTRKAEISKDFSAFFAPNFFRISIDPFSIFLRVEGFELPKGLKYSQSYDIIK